MPELPEVRTVAKVLKEKIIGKKITNYQIRYQNIIEDGSLSFDNLINKTILDITTYGKYLIFKIDNLYLVSHLRMEGKYYIKNIKDEISKHEHIIFILDDNISLRYHDTRKFGRMFLTDDLSKCKGLNKLGLEPFDKNINSDYLLTKFNKSNLPIKELLLDQSIIAGLGNIYANEVLFLSKINPFKKGKDITKNECNNIISSSKEILTNAIIDGGTTIKSYTSSLGVTGRFQQYLCVHKREGMPCLKCGTTILNMKINGRSTYFCPKCQGVIKTNEDNI